MSFSDRLGQFLQDRFSDIPDAPVQFVTKDRAQRFTEGTRATVDRARQIPQRFSDTVTREADEFRGRVQEGAGDFSSRLKGFLQEQGSKIPEAPVQFIDPKRDSSFGQRLGQFLSKVPDSPFQLPDSLNVTKTPPKMFQGPGEFAKAGGRFARDVLQATPRAGAIAAASIGERFTDKEIKFQPKKMGFMGKVLFGTEEIEDFTTEGEKLLTGFGVSEKYANKFGAPVGLLFMGLDLVPLAGGPAKKGLGFALEAIAKADDAADIVKPLQSIVKGSDEALQEAATILTKAKTVPEVKAVITRTQLAGRAEAAINAGRTVDEFVEAVPTDDLVDIARGSTISSADDAIEIATDLRKEAESVFKRTEEALEQSAKAYADEVAGVAAKADEIVAVTSKADEAIEPLLVEARKYKSADEFIENVDTELLADTAPRLKEIDKKITADGQVGGEKRVALEAEKTEVLTDLYNQAHVKPITKTDARVLPQEQLEGVQQPQLDEIRQRDPVAEGVGQPPVEQAVKQAEVRKLEPQTESLVKDSPTKETSQRQLKQVEQEVAPTRFGKDISYSQPKTIDKKSQPPVIESKSKAILSNDEYVQNRAIKKPNVSVAIKATGRDLKKGADKLLGAISTRLKNIHPSLKNAIRKYEYNLVNVKKKDLEVAGGFLKKLKNIDVEELADLDLAFKNGDETKIKEIVSKHGLEKEYAGIRTMLDDIYKRAESVGYDIGYQQNYFPRVIEDSEGFLEYFRNTDDWSIIDQAIKEQEELHGYLDIDQKASIINKLLRGFGSGRISLSKTGAMKGRVIDRVTPDLNRFYMASDEALVGYIESTNDAIEARKFFGKSLEADVQGAIKVEDTIGKYTLDLITEGKIKPSQEKELREILQARFAQRGITNGALGAYRNLEYISTMGSPISALTQIGDLAFAAYRSGYYQTIKSLGKTVVGKGKLTRESIGITDIAQEFSSQTSTARAVRGVFKMVGLEKMDSIGKGVLLDSVYSKYAREARRGKMSPDSMKRISAIFGDQSDAVVKEIASGELTENVKLLMFNDLLDVQPVALSEMPEQYLKGGNGRIFYMLKSYTLKQFDLYRNEIFQQMKTDPKGALKNAVRLGGALMVANATADEIKDFVLGRETSLNDRVVDNMLRLVGFSKFTIYEARTSGVATAVMRTILPPAKTIDSVLKDVNGVYKAQTQGKEFKGSEALSIGPTKLLYWWFGRGSRKTQDKLDRELPSKIYNQLKSAGSATEKLEIIKEYRDTGELTDSVFKQIDKLQAEEAAEPIDKEFSKAKTAAEKLEILKRYRESGELTDDVMKIITANESDRASGITPKEKGIRESSLLNRARYAKDKMDKAGSAQEKLEVLKELRDKGIATDDVIKIVGQMK